MTNVQLFLGQLVIAHLSSFSLLHQLYCFSWIKLHAWKQVQHTYVILHFLSHHFYNCFEVSAGICFAIWAGIMARNLAGPSKGWHFQQKRHLFCSKYIMNILMARKDTQQLDPQLFWQLFTNHISCEKIMNFPGGNDFQCIINHYLTFEADHMLWLNPYQYHVPMHDPPPFPGPQKEAEDPCRCPLNSVERRLLDDCGLDDGYLMLLDVSWC